MVNHGLGLAEEQRGVYITLVCIPRVPAHCWEPACAIFPDESGRQGREEWERCDSRRLHLWTMQVEKAKQSSDIHGPKEISKYNMFDFLEGAF